jgi:hypothetical protein
VIAQFMLDAVDFCHFIGFNLQNEIGFKNTVNNRKYKFKADHTRNNNIEEILGAEPTCANDVEKY